MQSVTGVGGTSEKHYQETPVHPNAGVGILLKTLAVVDADSAEEVTRWETEWPVLHSVPMETTSKGAHYYFRRTALCNELGLTNGPLNKQADFKSIIGTGTAGSPALRSAYPNSGSSFLQVYLSFAPALASAGRAVQSATSSHP
ncbi:hypothetical protein WJX77_001627 [Trebouxia sp. C0004]